MTQIRFPHLFQGFRSRDVSLRRGLLIQICSDGGGPVLFHAHTYERRSRCRQKETEGAADYTIPVFIGIGYANPEEPKLEQYEPDVDGQLHFGKWR